MRKTDPYPGQNKNVKGAGTFTKPIASPGYEHVTTDKPAPPRKVPKKLKENKPDYQSMAKRIIANGG